MIPDWAVEDLFLWLGGVLLFFPTPFGKDSIDTYFGMFLNHQLVGHLSYLFVLPKAGQVALAAGNFAACLEAIHCGGFKHYGF